jgi:tRNAThr (cytosine32-N3)-methyltransferase
MAGPSLGLSTAPTLDLTTLSISTLQSTKGPDPNTTSQPIEEVAEVPPHRSHDPNNNLKRTDPFKFGSRYLRETDNVFEFNAWDHVTPDASYYEYAETQYTAQRAAPVSEFDKKRFNNQPEKWWNKFYSNNTSNFFKDRKWLHQEFPILCQLTKADAAPAVVLEVGAGAGNTAFPILKANENPHLMVHACDFSSKAVELMKCNEAYDPAHIQASVWDIAGDNLPEGLAERCVDVVLLIFIFSALSPKQWDAAVRNVWRVLRPGGEVCFRDYGKGDLTQIRFKKGRLMEDNFYIRGDGTRVYFFEEDELRRIWSGAAHDKLEKMPRNEEQAEAKDRRNSRRDSEKECNPLPQLDEYEYPQHDAAKFEITSLGVDRRMLVNRQRQLKMYRCWMQGRFKKSTNDTSR